MIDIKNLNNEILAILLRTWYYTFAFLGVIYYMFNKEIKVSIVVPIYNTAEYLEKCLNSICSQTYRNIEIILIDDGSTDQSLNICNSFADKDYRIRVVHQENKGLSNARNKGMELATGSYISFFDSDDYVEPNMIETMLKVSLSHNADVCECSFDVLRVDGSVREFSSHQDDQIVIQDLYGLIDAYVKGVVKIIVWNKLYKLSEIKQFLFDENCIREEADYILRLCLAEKRFVVIDDSLYHYVKRQTTSLTGKKISSKLFSLKSWGEQMSGHIMTLGNEYHKNANIILYNSLAHILKHFIRDYKKNILAPNEFQQEIHLVVDQLLELFINVDDIQEFRDIENVLTIINDLMIVGVLKKELLGNWECFLNVSQNFSKKYVIGKGE